MHLLTRLLSSLDLDTGEGTIRRIFTLTKHFDDLFFHSVGLLLAG